MKLLDPIYPWQSWPRGYEPTVAELEAMTEEEYELWWDEEQRHSHMAEFRAAGRHVDFIKAVDNHPSNHVRHNNR